MDASTHRDDVLRQGGSRVVQGRKQGQLCLGTRAASELMTAPERAENNVVLVVTDRGILWSRLDLRLNAAP